MKNGKEVISSCEKDFILSCIRESKVNYLILCYFIDILKAIDCKNYVQAD